MFKQMHLVAGRKLKWQRMKNDLQMEFTHLFTEKESDISYLFTQKYNSVQAQAM